MTATANETRFFTKNDWGLVDMLRPLTREDFAVVGGIKKEADVRYKYATIWQDYELVTPICKEDRDTFRGLMHSAYSRNDKIILCLHLRQNVSLQGVRKEKQQAKLDAALAELEKRFDPEKMLAEKIADINKDTLASIAADASGNLRDASRHLRNPDKYNNWDNVDIKAYTEQLKELRRQKKELHDKIEALEKQEIRKYVEQNVPEPIRSATLKDLDEIGLHDDTPFGRRW